MACLLCQLNHIWRPGLGLAPPKPFDAQKPSVSLAENTVLMWFCVRGCTCDMLVLGYTHHHQNPMAGGVTGVTGRAAYLILRAHPSQQDQSQASCTQLKSCGVELS